MGKKKRSEVSSDREKWDKVFNGLVKLLKGQQEQLEGLVKERKMLEDRIKMQHERWVSDIRFFEDQLSVVKDSLGEKEMERFLEDKKFDLLTGLKQREVSLCKLKLEQTEDELADFRMWYNYLSNNLEGNSEKKGRNSDMKSCNSKNLEAEVKRLKLECEKIASEKNMEISVLSKEKGFVWNQYNILEDNLTTKLKSKQTEIDRANEKIAKVLSRVEMLQSSNDEKDENIKSLKTRVAEMEADTNKLREESLQLSQELELLRKSKTTEITPALRHCNTVAKTSLQEIKSSGRNRSKTIVKKESTPAQALVPLKDSEKGSRSSKRKGVDFVTISETPKLFSAAFKVPKLKISSTPVR